TGNIKRDKSRTRKIIRAHQRKDNPSILRRVHGNCRKKQACPRLGNNSLWNQCGREKRPINLRTKGKVVEYGSWRTRRIEHLRGKCRPESTRGIGRRNNIKTARVELLHRLVQ